MQAKASELRRIDDMIKELDDGVNPSVSSKFKKKVAAFKSKAGASADLPADPSEVVLSIEAAVAKLRKLKREGEKTRSGDDFMSAFSPRIDQITEEVHDLLKQVEEMGEGMSFELGQKGTRVRAAYQTVYWKKKKFSDTFANQCSSQLATFVAAARLDMLFDEEALWSQTLKGVVMKPAAHDWDLRCVSFSNGDDDAFAPIAAALNRMKVAHASSMEEIRSWCAESKPELSGCQSQFKLYSFESEFAGLVPSFDAEADGAGAKPWYVGIKSNFCRRSATHVLNPGAPGLFHNASAKEVFVAFVPISGIISAGLACEDYETFLDTKTGSKYIAEAVPVVPLMPGTFVSYGAGLLPHIFCDTQRTRRQKPVLEVAVLLRWLLGGEAVIAEAGEQVLRAVKRMHERHFATKASSQQWLERRAFFSQALRLH